MEYEGPPMISQSAKKTEVVLNVLEYINAKKDIAPFVSPVFSDIHVEIAYLRGLTCSA
jgi:hypothetical protein